MLLFLLSVGRPVWAQAEWSPTRPLNAGRAYHTATLLPSGNILVAGGMDDDYHVLSTAELFDSTTGDWAPAASLNHGRANHTATLLPSGQVLVTGGQSHNYNSEIASAELYDPASDSWTEVGSLDEVRAYHTATLLEDGRVLVAGAGGWSMVGGSDHYLASAEIFTYNASNLAASGWTATGSLDGPRGSHTATLMRDGKVLVLGGEITMHHFIQPPLSSATLYDPATGVWETLSTAMNFARSRHSATLLPNGWVLVAGGANSHPVPEIELYDPSSNWFSTALPHLNVGRGHHSATLLPDGRVMVVGGEDNGVSLNSAEIYTYNPMEPYSGSWASTGVLTDWRTRHTATLMPDGSVIVVGGLPNLNLMLASCEVLDPTDGTVTAANPMPAPRTLHVARLLGDGKVLVAGGINDGGDLSSSALYSKGVWTSAGNMAHSRYRFTGTLLADGRMLVVGGVGPGSATSEVFDPDPGPAADNWHLVADPLNAARVWHTATLLPDGRVLAVGGDDAGSAEIFDPGSESWLATGFPNQPREAHTATLLADGKVLVTGGGTGTGIRSCEIFDPATGAWAYTGMMNQGRGEHAAVLLTSGKVLVVGGDFPVLATAEIYDPATGVWMPTGSLNVARNGLNATLLPSGHVLVTGGRNEKDSFELFNPASGKWTLSSATLTQGRYYETVTPLASGDVLVAGGSAYLDGGFTLVRLASCELIRIGVFDDDRRPLVFLGESNLASYDPGLEVPACATTGTSCHSGGLLDGRGSMTGGIEPNAPNTIFSSCADGNSGTYHVHPSIDRMHVFAADDLPLSPGSEARVEATIWASGSLDRLDLFYTANAASPSWVYFATLAPPSGGLWTLSSSYTLPAGSFQAVRGRLRIGGSVAPCGGGPYEDHDDLAFAVDLAPQPALDPIRFDGDLVVNGVRFGGQSEASSGRANSSPVNYPLIQLMSVEGGKRSWLVPEPISSFADEPMTLTVANLPPLLDPGLHLLTVVTAGVPSLPKLVNVECSVDISGDPQSLFDVEPGGSATFEVVGRGARGYQWYTCSTAACLPGDWKPIDEGGDRSSYTTPPVTGLQSGTRYRAEVRGSCYDPVLSCGAQPDSCQASAEATLTVRDEEFPKADVLTPDGGEFWLLSGKGDDGVSPSADDPPPNTELVTWSMSDNVRICSVSVLLEYSDDGGTIWAAAPAGGGLPVIFGPGGTCVVGETTTSVLYTVPQDPPSGTSGSLYRIRVHAVDHAGNPVTDYSNRPFFIVKANPEIKKTLILADVARMQDGAVMGTGAISAADATALSTKLLELAGHPRVLGVVVDLSAVSTLQSLLGQWDSGAVGANDVLFAAGGLHDYLLDELLPVYSSTEYVVLVGDDRVIPFARLIDGGRAPH